MKKILGLDIGVASIGWALIQEPENINEQYSILGMGSRIIPLSSDEADEFSKGNAISKNANRRQKRGQRRGGQRYKMRKYKLRCFLTSLNMMPDKSLFLLNATELYGLRNKAIKQQLSLQEIGRIFYHLNQKRGYKSNRKVNNDDDKKTEKAEKEEKGSKPLGYLDKIQERESKLKEAQITIGQFFFQQLQQNPFFRIKDNIFLRKSYEAEFISIWNYQKKFYSDRLTDDNFKKIFSEIIYYQRPLKSQRHLVSECIFESTYAKDSSGKTLTNNSGGKIIIRPKAIAKSNPLFQVAKVWQDINNLRIRDKAGKDIVLTIEQKDLLFTDLNKKEKLSTTELKKKLGLIPADSYYVNLKKDFIEGNKTISSIRKALTTETDNQLRFELKIIEKEITNYTTGEVTKIPVIDPEIEKQPLHRLWHAIYSIEDTEILTRYLTNVLGFSYKDAVALSKVDFSKGGYGSISAKAYKKIIPSLMRGNTYDKACLEAGYRHSDYKTTAENLSRCLSDKLILYPKNTLKNPVVEKIINQVINLVNAIIDKDNGLVKKEERHNNRFEIRVELGRELKQNADQRNRVFKNNNLKDKQHKEIVDRLQKELGFSNVSRRDIEKVKLWREFDEISPYEPNKPVQLFELFNGDYEIEHIIPKSRLFDDSFSNKTIARVALNKQKDNSTAYDFMQSLGEQQLHDYTEFIKRHVYKKDGISKTKLNYLLMSGDKIPDDFINRQMRETAYISRETMKLLKNIVYNVYSTSGSVTDYLRNHWGINQILKKLNFEKYKAADQIKNKTITKADGSIHEVEEINKEIWSKRDDHRHHAIDALVVALTNQGIIQKLNTLNQTHSTRKELKESSYKFPEPWKGFVRDATSITDSILISFKTGKKVYTTNKNKIIIGRTVLKEMTELTPRGFLHKDTVYGQIKRYEKVPLSTRFTKWNELVHQSTKKQLEERLIANNNDPKKAFADTSKNPLPESLKKVTLFANEFVVRYDLNADFKAADANYIVDKKIKELVKERLRQFNNNSKEAFQNLAENPIWLNYEKQIPINTVRCFTGLSDLIPLHQDVEGRPIDFVSTRNNHHIAIYADENGNLQENVVTFWDALERKKNNLPIVIKNPSEIWSTLLEKDFDDQNILKKLPRDKWKFITSLSQNEMFVFGFTNEELRQLIKDRNYNQISKHLFRVQKISEMYYTFRHHLESTTDDKKKGGEVLSKTIGRLITIQSFKAFNEKKPIKVRINLLGELVKMGE